jgi:hypothetical protein
MRRKLERTELMLFVIGSFSSDFGFRLDMALSWQTRLMVFQTAALLEICTSLLREYLASNVVRERGEEVGVQVRVVWAFRFRRRIRTIRDTSSLSCANKI